MRPIRGAFPRVVPTNCLELLTAPVELNGVHSRTRTMSTACHAVGLAKVQERPPNCKLQTANR